MSQKENLPISVQTDLLTAPPSSRRIPPWLTYLSALIGVIYILNPTSGLLEILPDNIPFIGNLDEGVAYTFIWYGLLEFFEGKKYRQQLKQQTQKQEEA